MEISWNFVRPEKWESWKTSTLEINVFRCFGVGGTCPVLAWRWRILFTTCTPGRELPTSVLMSGKLSGIRGWWRDIREYSRYVEIVHIGRKYFISFTKFLAPQFSKRCVVTFFQQNRAIHGGTGDVPLSICFHDVVKTIGQIICWVLSHNVNKDWGSKIEVRGWARVGNTTDVIF